MRKKPKTYWAIFDGKEPWVRYIYYTKKDAKDDLHSLMSYGPDCKFKIRKVKIVEVKS